MWSSRQISARSLANQGHCGRSLLIRRVGRRTSTAAARDEPWKLYEPAHLCVRLGPQARDRPGRDITNPRRDSFADYCCSAFICSLSLVLQLVNLYLHRSTSQDFSRSQRGVSREHDQRWRCELRSGTSLSCSPNNTTTRSLCRYLLS
jgi:hypothetical protein